MKSNKYIVLILLLLSFGFFIFSLNTGPKEISQIEMEKEADAFQEKYNIKEVEIEEVFRNKDKSKWKN